MAISLCLEDFDALCAEARKIRVTITDRPILVDQNLHILVQAFKKRWRNMYSLFMDPLGPNTRRYDMH